MSNPIKDGEIELIFALILNKAKSEKTDKIFLDNDELAESLIGDTAWKIDTGDSKKDIENIARRDNRIQNLMQRKLAKMGIKEFKFEKTGIEFTFESKILDFSKNVSTEVEQVKTTTDYKTKFFPPTYFPDLCAAFKERMNILLTGPHGCGKSRTIEEAAAYVGLSHVRIPIAQITDPAVLVGCKEIVNQDGVSVTKYVRGVLTKMVEKGGVAILDEFDAANSSVITALNNIIENDTDIIIHLEDGSEEVIKRHPDFIIAATANTRGRGDTKGFYPSREQGDLSSWSRLVWSCDVDYDSKMESSIVSQWLHPNIVKALYDPNKGIFVKIRQSIKNGEINDHLSFRNIEMFARKYKVFGWHKGLVYLLMNHMNEAYHETIKNIIRVQMGNEFIPSTNDYDSKDSITYIPALKASIQSKKELEGFV